MEDTQLEKLRYPIGKFQDPASYSSMEISNWIDEIEEIPALIRKEFNQVTEEMLEESYRPNGWTTRQVVHHLVDSHMNAYVRFKLTLTEDRPTIKPYKEALWAELSDSKNAPVNISLDLLEALHKRLVIILRNINEDQLNRSYFHPDNKREYQLKTAIALYAWHGKHHLAHIRIVKSKFAIKY